MGMFGRRCGVTVLSSTPQGFLNTFEGLQPGCKGVQVRSVRKPYEGTLSTLPVEPLCPEVSLEMRPLTLWSLILLNILC